MMNQLLIGINPRPKSLNAFLKLPLEDRLSRFFIKEFQFFLSQGLKRKRYGETKDLIP